MRRSEHRPPPGNLTFQKERLDRIETAPGPLMALAGAYPDGHVVASHSHRRSQLLYARSGVVMVATAAGRWMVPPEHAMWIPAGIEHSVEMLGDVEMHSTYLDPGVPGPAAQGLTVLAMSDLMRALIDLLIRAGSDDVQRTSLAMALLIVELPALSARPLGLPLPADPRLARLCRAYVADPASGARIDGWASAMGMSRRSFTRLFRRETGLGLSTWRQQACLFAALPRLAAGEPVTTVAIDLGYASVPAFTTMFTRTLGMAPRAYFRRATGIG